MIFVGPQKMLYVGQNILIQELRQEVLELQGVQEPEELQLQEELQSLEELQGA